MFHHEGLVLLLHRVGPLEICRQRLQGRARRRGRHPRLQPPHDHELPPGAIVELRLVFRLEIIRDLIVNPERQPDLGREDLGRAGEPLRENPDHRERPAVDRDRRAQQRRIEPVLLPIIVTHDRDRRTASGRLLLRRERAAMYRHYAHDHEII